MPNTTQTGTMTEGIILAALLKDGKTVLVPFGNQQDYDLVMEDQSCFFRIQCKTGRIRRGSIYFNLYTMAQAKGEKRHIRRCYGDKIDFYGVYCPENGKTYLVPQAAVSATLGVLRIEIPANGQKKNVRWASDFEI